MALYKFRILIIVIIIIIIVTSLLCDTAVTSQSDVCTHRLFVQTSTVTWCQKYRHPAFVLKFKASKLQRNVFVVDVVVNAVVESASPPASL